MGSYFSEEANWSHKGFYSLLLFLIIVYTFISFAAPLLTPECDIPVATQKAHARALTQGLEGGLEDAPNPSYVPDPCRWRREVVLLGMNKWEVRARAAPRTPLS